MLTVSLSGVRLLATVGLFPEEAFVKNEIEVNISVSQKADIEQLPFIDYALLYEIIKKAVSTPTTLLEHIVQRIVKDVDSRYPGAGIQLSLRKLHPPLGGCVGISEVMWTSSL